MGLAPLMVQKVFETVLMVAKEGVTILLIEQNAKLALEVSNRGYVMESGEITLAGRREEAAARSGGACRLSRRIGMSEVAAARTFAAAPPPAAHLHARIVPWRHAFAWYEEAMRLWKQAPVPWALLALLTLASEFGLQAMPTVGTVLGKIVTPLVACGMVFAAAVADRGRRPPLRARRRGLSRPAPPPSPPSSLRAS